jgi:hypothetical protein
MRTSRLALIVAASTALVAAPLTAVAVAGAAQVAGHGRSAATSVTLGTTDGVINSCGDSTAVMSGTAPGGPTWTSPIDGVVTSWKHGGGPNPGSLRLLVVQPSTVTPGAFAIVGRSAKQAITPNAFNTFPARVPIAAGQRLGLDVDAVGNVYCATIGQASDIFSFAVNVDAGTATEFSPTFNAATARLNLSAVVESDTDHDGFGDVTQDLCPESAATQAACPAPDTKVKKTPPKKSSKRKAKITFSSTVAGSTFTCKVDKKDAKPCTSPFKKTLKPGKHKVVITAVSPFGILDPTPVTVKFTVAKP